MIIKFVKLLPFGKHPGEKEGVVFKNGLKSKPFKAKM